MNTHEKLVKASRHFLAMRASTTATRSEVLAAERYLSTILAQAERELAAAAEPRRDP